MLQDSISCYHQFCGAFPQISGLRYRFKKTVSYDDGHSEYDIHSELLSVTYENGTELGSEPITVVTSDFVVLNSKLNGEPLYNMVRMNDALPLLHALQCRREQSCRRHLH